MKKRYRIISIVVLTIIMISFATISNGFEISNLTGNQTQITPLRDAGNNIVNVITTIGTVISVIVLVALGIKYMIGSVEEKAEYKKTLMPYVIGACLVFAASKIAQLIYNLAIQL